MNEGKKPNERVDDEDMARAMAERSKGIHDVAIGLRRRGNEGGAKLMEESAHRKELVIEIQDWISNSELGGSLKTEDLEEILNLVKSLAESNNS